jgi:hypothetical protein
MRPTEPRHQEKESRLIARGARIIHEARQLNKPSHIVKIIRQFSPHSGSFTKTLSNFAEIVFAQDTYHAVL